MTADAVAGKQTLDPWWVAASAVGAAVGIAVGRPLAELVREPFSQIVGGLPTVAFFGAFFGLCLGLGHTLTRWRTVPAVEWTLASTLGGAVGYVLGVMLAALITDPLRGQVIVYVSEVLGYLVFGAVVGVFLGLTQWTIWRTRGSRSGVAGIAGVTRWTVLSALGWALGFTVTAGVGLELTRFPSVTVRDLIFGGFAGLIAGGVQALVAAGRNGR